MATQLGDHQEVGICLIGGTGRSGTTILRKVFGRHPSVAVAPTETRFLIDPDGLVDFFDSFAAGWSPYVFDIRIRRLERLLLDIGDSGISGRVISRLSSRSRDAGESGSKQRPRRSVHPKRVLAAAGRDARISRLLPRYPTVNLSGLWPGYRDAVNRLIESLTEFEFEGRWTGTPRWQESRIAFGPPLTKPVLARRLGDFYKEVCNGLAGGQGSTHFVEDSPLNILSFDRVLMLTPEAKLVHIYRDPRDVVASYIQKRWGWSPENPDQAAKLYRGIAETWFRVKDRLPSGSFREISLEQFCGSPKPTLKEIAGFWGLSWNDSLMTVDLSKSNSGRWRHDLDKKSQLRVTEILEPYIKAYGYSS